MRQHYDCAADLQLPLPPIFPLQDLMNRRHFVRCSTAACYLAYAGHTRAENTAGDRDILLGQTGILSGPLGVSVKEYTAGAQLVFSEINANGGVAGRQIKLLSLDDELRPDLAVANYRRLLEEHKVFAFFGCVGSGTTAAAANILKESGAPSIGCYAVADSAREKVRGMAYSVRATSGREVLKLVQQLKTLGVNRLAAAGLDNAGGNEVLQLIEQTTVKEGLIFTDKVLVKPNGSNAQQAGRSLTDADPQAVLLYLSGTLSGGLIDGMRKSGSDAAFYGTSIVQGPALAKSLGKGAHGVVISQVMPYPWRVTDTEIYRFTKLCERAKLDVSYVTLEGYINGRVMAEALTRAGRPLTHSKLLAALRSLRMRIAGMDIDFTDPLALAGSHFVDLVLVTANGGYVR